MATSTFDYDVAARNAKTVGTSAATSGAGAASTTAASTQVAWSQLGSTGFIILVVAIAGLTVATVYLLHRRKVQQSRADAYAAVAADTATSIGAAA